MPFPGEISTKFECGNCRGLRFHFSHARSAVAARGMVLDLIHRYKYRHALWLEPFLAELLVSRAAPELRSRHWDMLVPVPLHPMKEREREFNQARRLGFRLSLATGIPLHSRCLTRVRFTRTQTKLSRPERMENVRNAFELSESEPLKGKSVVLLDDVLTTGATLNACAQVLRRAGTEEVCAWTLARGLIN